MSNREFETWGELINGAETVVEFILKQDVAPVAEDILRTHIINDIYKAYTPKENGWVNSKGEKATYERRWDLPKKVASKLSRDVGQSSHYDTLIITSLAKPTTPVVKGSVFTEMNKDGGSFLALLESGRMGIWRNGFPRPAVSNAERNMKRSRLITRAIKQGIKREMEI